MEQAQERLSSSQEIVPKQIIFDIAEAASRFDHDSTLLSGFRHSTLRLFPYFLLHKKPTFEHQIKVKEFLRCEGLIFELTWEVNADQQLGLPRLFERRLQMYLEHIILSLPRPIQNPIYLSSYRSLGRRMAYCFSNGQLITRIKEALYRMAFTTITVKLMYRRSQSSLYHGDIQTFTLYDKVILPGDPYRNGTTARNVVLYLSKPFLSILNSSYRTLPNFDFHKSLSLPTSSRLCEILAPSFLESSEPVEYFYSTLCNFMPLKRRLYPSCARKQLDPAHEDLVRSGFLKSWQWIKISGIRYDWKIRYSPAPKWQFGSSSTVHALVF